MILHITFEDIAAFFRTEKKVFVWLILLGFGIFFGTFAAFTPVNTSVHKRFCKGPRYVRYSLWRARRYFFKTISLTKKIRQEYNLYK